jgi:hypothetical protein
MTQGYGLVQFIKRFFKSDSAADFSGIKVKTLHIIFNKMSADNQHTYQCVVVHNHVEITAYFTSIHFSNELNLGIIKKPANMKFQRLTTVERTSYSILSLHTAGQLHIEHHVKMLNITRDVQHVV